MTAATFSRAFGGIDFGPVVVGEAVVGDDGFESRGLAVVEGGGGDESGDGEATVAHLLEDGGVVGRGVPRHEGEEWRGFGGARWEIERRDAEDAEEEEGGSGEMADGSHERVVGGG
jgi:hypothetical protein